MTESSDKDQRRLYGDLAWTWPIVSAPETYVEESEESARLIREQSQIEAKTLLNMGCGGGHNDWTLKKHFRLTGADISEDMLALARRRNPEVTYHVGDMRTLRLGKTFDAVVIFDSIDYMLTEDDLRAAFETAFLHVKPGGVFLTYEEIRPETYAQNRTQHQVGREGDVEIVFIENYYDPDPSDTTIECTFVYLIRRGGKLEIETDRHVCGLFPTETWMTLLREVGFKVTELPGKTPEEATTFICLKPPAAA
jgi:SAM-dependent methyltransferase